uniref:Uncharacterized protein n=2 Tax=Heterosigma akashiwo TaxID=2829 RepID=A0A6V2PNN2_HETAK|mmetsp:Transcript_8947/g.15206  ORF Transcript_8947/g.15206 Transcript_8947/m.15206 type:complete len:224 (+) Transcript_8947:47-718(+)
MADPQTQNGSNVNDVETIKQLKSIERRVMKQQIDTKNFNEQWRAGLQKASIMLFFHAMYLVNKKMDADIYVPILSTTLNKAFLGLTISLLNIQTVSLKNQLPKSLKPLTWGLAAFLAVFEVVLWVQGSGVKESADEVPETNPPPKRLFPVAALFFAFCSVCLWFMASAQHAADKGVEDAQAVLMAKEKCTKIKGSPSPHKEVGSRNGSKREEQRISKNAKKRN